MEFIAECLVLSSHLLVGFWTLSRDLLDTLGFGNEYRVRVLQPPGRTAQMMTDADRVCARVCAKVTRGMVFIVLVSLASSLVRVPFHLFRILCVDTHFEMRYRSCCTCRRARIAMRAFPRRERGLTPTSLGLSPSPQERRVDPGPVVLGADEDVCAVAPIWRPAPLGLPRAPQLGSALLLDMYATSLPPSPRRSSFLCSCARYHDTLVPNLPLRLI
jgi:hypothetical protein